MIKFDRSVISPPNWSYDDAKHEYKYARDNMTPLKDKISIFKKLVPWNVLQKKYNKAKLIDWYTELSHENKKPIYAKKEHRAFLTFILDDKFSHSPQLIRWYRKLKMEHELKDLQRYFCGKDPFYKTLRFLIKSSHLFSGWPFQRSI